MKQKPGEPWQLYELRKANRRVARALDDLELSVRNNWKMPGTITPDQERTTQSKRPLPSSMLAVLAGAAPTSGWFRNY